MQVESVSINLKLCKRYNIALLPQNLKQFVEIAQPLVDYSTYKLSIKETDNSSLPHVTLVQFYCKSELTLSKVKNNIKQNININFPLTIQFQQLHQKQDVESNTWYEIWPDNPNPCNKLFNIFNDLLIKYDLKAINSPYIPHLTLARISPNKDDFVIKPVIFNKVDLVDKFQLVLAESDNIGQLIRIIEWL